MQHISPLLLHDYFNVSLFEAKASIEKAIGSAIKPFSNEYIWQVKSLLHVQHVCIMALCHHITDSLLFASL
jgi:hypothetical protein